MAESATQQLDDVRVRLAYAWFGQPDYTPIHDYMGMTWEDYLAWADAHPEIPRLPRG